MQTKACIRQSAKDIFAAVISLIVAQRKLFLWAFPAMCRIPFSLIPLKFLPLRLFSFVTELTSSRAGVLISVFFLTVQESRGLADVSPKQKQVWSTSFYDAKSRTHHKWRSNFSSLLSANRQSRRNTTNRLEPLKMSAINKMSDWCNMSVWRVNCELHLSAEWTAGFWWSRALISLAVIGVTNCWCGSQLWKARFAQLPRGWLSIGHTWPWSRAHATWNLRLWWVNR